MTRLVSPEEQELRVRLLELALRHFPGDPVAEAARYLDFVEGRVEQSPRQRINAALDQANVS